MGVHGLWELLAPVGRRVSVETLAGKKLAIDASIWMVQFMKAMRDEKGEMVRNAHILGFFRRICKLLFLRTKPVFVFDGGTPALKRRTVIARRRQRENAQAKVRKTAEKLLLNHLKAMRLKEIAEDVKNQRQSSDVKGKKPMIEETNSAQDMGKGNDEVDVSYNQEELDAMLAACLAAEENEGFTGDASTSGSGVPRGEVWGDEDEDDDEEMVLPEIDGKVDPAVLASLPPSMQLDLLVQMRERLMAENRQKYQKVKKAPERFSELQIQSYLKTVAFRREIHGVQRAAAGRGIGGVQTSRIASEANREFIFSSSFTGDKEAFTSSGQEKTDSGESLQQPVTLSTNEVTPTKRSDAASALCQGDNGKTFNDDVETYTDERGRMRVSRVRALGIRMTRDLQRNLDLMKEMEEKEGTNEKNGQAMAKDMVDVLSNLSDRIQQQEVAAMNNDGSNDEVEIIEDPTVIKGTSIEVSFEDTHEFGSFNEDDSLFSCLVAGEPVIDFSVDNSTYPKQSLQSTSDCEWEEGLGEDITKTKSDDDEVEWEEGIIGDKTDTVNNEDEVEWEEGSIEDITKTKGDDGEVEWEEGFKDTPVKSPSCQVQKDNTVSESVQKQVMFQKGVTSNEREVEWENEFLDSHLKFSSTTVENCPVSKGDDEEETELQEAIRRSLEDAMTQKFTGKYDKDQKIDLARDSMKLNHPENNLEVNLQEVNLAESNLVFEHLNRYSGGSGALTVEINSASETTPVEKVLSMKEKQTMDSSDMDDSGHAVENLVGTSNLTASFPVTTSEAESTLSSATADAQNMFGASLNDRTCGAAKIGDISVSISISDADKLAKDKIFRDSPMAEEELASQPSFIEVNERDKAFDGQLEEELRFLDKEREELGSEQRRLERNAEGVNSEMFVECQELLQMFGLPYIIAPMEAEAQCAFMELLNLVDGVVTDDSDAFLFGARNVYKNIFDDRKYVETYLLKDIENELGLDREKLIHMALLLGSDYTEGVSGIGIVNAIEVVNAFPEKEGLREFREWIESPDPNILGNIGGNSKRKASKEETSSDQNVPVSADDADRIKCSFMNKHRNVSKNWHIPSSFPSDVVISAYASPQVDKSSESFSWGKPDLSILRKLCWEKFGWGTSKADELLLPVLKEYNKHETQLRLEAFYTFNERFAKIKSKRISKAVKGITGQKSSELLDETIQQAGSRKKRKTKPAEDATIQSGIAGNSNQTENIENPTTKKSKSRQTKETTSKKSTNTSLNTGKEREKRGGRGRGQASKRGTDFSIGDCKRSHDGESHDSGRDEELQPEMSEAPRRSGRVRKSVNYTVSDEVDDRDKESENVFDETDGNKTTGIDLECRISVDGIDELYNSMDENNFSQMDSSQINELFSQSKSSLDYLQSGGGFCVEEDDDDSAIPDFVNEENHEISIPQTLVGKRVSSDTEVAMIEEAQNESDDDSRNRFASSFRAMPNLRRKRRKT